MTSYDIIIHATEAEFKKFSESDKLVSVRQYEISPYILQDNRRIFVCTIRHHELEHTIPRYKVFDSINTFKNYIKKYKL